MDKREGSRMFPAELRDYYRQHPLVLIDVGASGGVSDRWRSAHPHLQVVGFEPDAREFANLATQQDGNVRYLNAFLHNENSPVTLFLTKKQQTTSMFRPNREVLDRFPESGRFEIVGTATMDADTLDSHLEAIDDADFIKVDTQGSELFVLQGARDTMRTRAVFGLEIEVEFVELYSGQPLFADVDAFVRGQGFELFDLQAARWKRTIGVDYGKARGQLVYGNVLYLKRTAEFRDALARIEDDVRRKTKALRAMSICVLYGYIDYALELLQATAGCFSRAEHDALLRWLTQDPALYRRIPNVRGRDRIARVLFRLWELIRPDHNGWASMDNHLGNG